MKRIVADKGKGYYHIVTNGKAHEAELYVASVLYQYLFKATGAIVPYFSDVDRCPRHSPEIHIGADVRGIKTDVSHLTDEGFVIKTRDEDIVIAGKTPRGTVYGVYHFLEKFINFKCFTKDIETFDKVETLVVEDIDVCENPVFEYREVYFRLIPIWRISLKKWAEKSNSLIFTIPFMNWYHLKYIMTSIPSIIHS